MKHIVGYSWELAKLTDEQFIQWFLYKYWSNQYIPPYAWNRIAHM